MKKINIVAAFSLVVAVIIGTLFFAKTRLPKNTVIISDYAYLPKKITVKKGTTITWINRDIAKHTVTADGDLTDGPNSEFFGQNKSYQFRFTKSGVFSYHCDPHPYMKAVVEVTN